MAKASELRKDRPWFEIGLYGDPGSGKTTWAATAPDPLILLFEEQGLEAVATANPDADVEMVGRLDQVKRITDALVQGTVIKTANGPRLQYTLDGETRQCGTLVLDGWSDYEDQMLQFLTNGNPEKMELQHWNQQGIMARRALTKLRGIQCNKIVLFHAKEDVDDLQARVVRPAVRGALKGSIGQFFNVFGFARRVEVSGRREHVIDWSLSDRYITKKPPTWPTRTRQRFQIPGDTTLGSIALAMHGAHAIHEPTDDASFAKLHVMQYDDETTEAPGEAGILENPTAPPKKTRNRAQ